MADFKTQSKMSRLDFMAIVRPVLLGLIPKATEIISTEGTGRVERALDCCSGIDALAVVRRGLDERTDLEGIASRIQYGSTCFETFTLRLVKLGRPASWNTEFEKREWQLSHPSGIRAHWASHAYLDEHGGRLLGVGVAPMGFLMDVASARYKSALAHRPTLKTCILRMQPRQQIKVGELLIRRTGNACFLVIPWMDVPSVFVEGRPAAVRSEGDGQLSMVWRGTRP